MDGVNVSWVLDGGGVGFGVENQNQDLSTRWTPIGTNEGGASPESTHVFGTCPILVVGRVVKGQNHEVQRIEDCRYPAHRAR